VFYTAAGSMRGWLEQLLSTKSLAAAGAAAVGLVGYATTQNPLFAWLMLGGGGTWAALMYYLAGQNSPAIAAARSREAALREVERALHQYPMPRDEDARDRWRAREQQLRRIVDLERLILNDLPSTSSGVSLLSPDQQLEVTDFVDQAIELAKRRVLLIRALQANPPRQLEAEVRDLIQRRQYATGRVAEEMDELLNLKREQEERSKRWLEDLNVSELNLDQIETFLRALAYDQTVTQSTVSQRIERLKTRVQARKESVEELERHINAAMSP
jgi:hypothetical protein